MARIFVLLFLFSGTISLCADKNNHQSFEHILEALDKEPGYTVNFTDVSAVEIVKFLSKIGNLNFLYNEAELNFDVTIVSEQETSLADIMTAFLQILRINNLFLTEEGPNLIIHNQADVGKIADVVSENNPYQGKNIPPILTRVFSIQKGNPDSIAALLKPMLSKQALIEVSSATRHLIVTDLVANIVKTADILKTLDAPENSLDVSNYQAKSTPITSLIPILKQILYPISDGNPLIIVPQVETNTAYIVTTPFLLKEALEIFKVIDTPASIANQKLSGKNIFIYEIKHQDPEALISALKEVSISLQKESKHPSDLSMMIDHMKYVKASHSLIFIGNEHTLPEIKQLLNSLDTVNGLKYQNENASKFYIYPLKEASDEEILKSLDIIISRMKASSNPNHALLRTLENAKYIPDTNSLVFTGPETAIDEVKTLLPQLDTINQGGGFYIYKLENVTEKQLQNEINGFIARLKKSETPDLALIKALSSFKYVETSNSVIFTGGRAAIEKVKDLLPSLDVKDNSEFYVYSPKNMDGEELLKSLNELVSNLKKSGLADDSLLNSIDSARWNPSSHSITFTGNKESLTRLKQIIPSIDIVQSKRADIFIYKIQNASKMTLEEGLQNLEKSLSKSDPVRKCISTMQYLPESNSIVFKGSNSTIERVKEYLLVLDGSNMAHGKMTFEIVKLKNAPGDIVLKELKQIADNMQRSGLRQDPVVESIDTIRFIKSTNSFYVTGTPDTIKEVSALISQFDIIRPKGSLTDNSNFFIYKPTYASPNELRESLITVADDLKAAGLTDQSLITTILTVRVVESSHSLLFTGEPASIEKVQELLKTLDNPEAAKPITHIGETTFFIYQLKYVSGPQFSKHLKAIASDLKKTANPDKQLIESIDNMRYVSETNSFVFTGTEEALKKIQSLSTRFDNPEFASNQRGPAETYIVYKPKYQSGEELIQTLHDFEQNLSSSGVEDRELIDVINNLKWMPKTQSILISGQAEATKKVKDLLERFDTVGDASDKPSTSIETIDDTSFLVYKLQYHQGLDIQTALQALASDLGSQSRAAGKSNNIVEAINSIQWIQVTNSLIGSGNAQTLERLRELIKGLDVPLRQIMIDVLVIETNDTDALDISLQWASQGNYKNRLAYSTGTNSQNLGSSQSQSPAATFVDGLRDVTATNRPKSGGSNQATGIPIPTGGSLGVIGDIILHHGKSYFALGDFITAVKATSESFTVWNQKIITQDNQTSTIFIGQNIPFTGSVVNTQQTSGQTVSSSVEYRDVGTKLIITPTIGSGDILTLEIDEELTSELNQGDDSQVDTNNLSGIRTSKKTTQTRVTMPDRHFFALAGEINDSMSRLKTGIPCLGSLPILGAAFSDNQRTYVTSNTIIFIYPQIIHTFEEYEDYTKGQDDLYREQTPTKSDWDRAMNIIRTEEDY